MNRDDFHTLYTFHDWANDRLLAMLSQAFGEETDLCHAADALVQAIQETTTHVLSAQWIWRERWEGRSPTAMLSPQDYPTLAALQEAFLTERARFWTYFEGVDEEVLRRVIHSTRANGEPCIFPLWQMLQHVVTHAMYHRGQVTGRLLDLGLEPLLQPTDLIAFYAELNRSHPL